MKYFFVFYLFHSPVAFASRGQGGGGSGEYFLGFFGVVIVFLLSRTVGEKIAPNSDLSSQVLVGVIVVLLGIAVLLKIAS